MSNRFAWAWQVTRFEIPVVLVYLGFLEAEEMVDLGRPFTSAENWTERLKAHSNCGEHKQGKVFVRHKRLLPDKVWDHTWAVSGTTVSPIIRSLKTEPLARYTGFFHSAQTPFNLHRRRKPPGSNPGRKPPPPGGIGPPEPLKSPLVRDVFVQPNLLTTMQLVKLPPGHLTLALGMHLFERSFVPSKGGVTY